MSGQVVLDDKLTHVYHNRYALKLSRCMHESEDNKFLTGSASMSHLNRLLPTAVLVCAPSITLAQSCDANTINSLLKLGADPVILLNSCQSVVQKIAPEGKSTVPAGNSASTAYANAKKTVASDVTASTLSEKGATAAGAAAGSAPSAAGVAGQGAKGGAVSTATNKPNSDFLTAGQWGLGLAVMRNSHNVITDAPIQSGIVRASAESRAATEIVMTRSFYFTKTVRDKDDIDRTICSSADWGKSPDLCWGLFLAVGVNPSGGSGGSSNQFVDMVGAGLLFGFGQVKDGGLSDKQHNIGIGWGRRFGVKTLGDGFSSNAAPPKGETQVRYKTTDFNAPFIFYTYNFSQNQ